MSTVSLSSLVVGVSVAMLPLLVVFGEAGAAEPDANTLPLAEICLLPNDMDANTCAAFFLNRDGYQICLRDDMSGKVRCSGTFSTDDEDDEDNEEETRPTGGPSAGFKI
ncbi:hypothetical protein [Sinorhizobium meliloti]|uniref:hypothetical protein n=1 Tax=Rhizobium meliloti TaxID=382 RepID=UPI002090EB7C|nr:hypothetical protein [Sinorhizobium meliloti]MCO5965068.1 hypothetical protein [Sinorhizobium meliloti]